MAKEMTEIIKQSLHGVLPVHIIMDIAPKIATDLVLKGYTRNKNK